MGKYIGDVAARCALETAARHAGKAGRATPFVWSGASWTTSGGEWRDWPFVRRGMGEWLRDLVSVLRTANADAVKVAERREELRGQASDLRFVAATQALEADARTLMLKQASELWAESERIVVPAMTVELDTLEHMEKVSAEILSAPDGRATQLLALASQFEEFRAPMNDPAAWVRRLGAAPRGVHVRTTAVWDAFCVAEPVLSRSLGTTTGKRALFAAMDKRFGARRKLSGYEGWRGVALDD